MRAKVRIVESRRRGEGSYYSTSGFSRSCRHFFSFGKREKKSEGVGKSFFFFFSP